MQQCFFVSSYRPGESHQVAYTQWGDPNNPRLLFCAHGLSRNGRDFDTLAAAMADQYHVVCPDYPGRGQSEKLANDEDYENLNYVVDSLNLLERFDKKTIDWVGTSMGGIIGMFLAAKGSSPIHRLVLNDVGTHISQQALEEIARYLGPKPHFENREQARHYFKTAYVGFGPMTTEQIEQLTEHGIWAMETGGFELSCDTGIIDRFVNAEFSDVDLWPSWNQISVPCMVIRGVHSTLLTAQEMQKMVLSRKNVSGIEFSRCAHAPSLMHPDHIKAIRKWLLNP